ncbi:MAG: hypothetical protein NTW74_11015 [Acidobacteria bacterium]|nr:hypothetical protein [Acidobacteriota bacterium]
MAQFKVPPARAHGSTSTSPQGFIQAFDAAADSLSQSMVQSIVASYAVSHGISEANARTVLILLGLGLAGKLEEDAARRAKNKAAFDNAMRSIGGGGLRASDETIRALANKLRTLFS